MSIRSLLTRQILYPFYIKKNKSSTLHYIRQIEVSQYLPPEVIKENQWNKIRKLIKYSFDNTEFYRRRFMANGLHPEAIKTYNDFLQIPPLTKSEIKENIENMISNTYIKKDLFLDKTGGSTGTPLNFYYDKSKSEYREAFRMRSTRWTSWDIGDKVATIWGAQRDISKGMKDRLRGYFTGDGIILDAYSITHEKMAQFTSLLGKYKPKIIAGYAGSISLYAKYLSDMGISDIQPRAVITSAEALSATNRQLIERVFNCKVFERYGCRELGPIASECEEHKCLHINAEGVFLEILNPETGLPADIGEMGEIVITDLLNHAMPFIRYKIGDMGRVYEDSCNCNRGLPCLGAVEGRTVDCIKTAKGQTIAGPMAVPLICDIPGLLQAQIIQESLDSLTVKVRKDKTFDQASYESLRKRSKKIFGDSMRIDVEYVDSIPSEPSGKYRFVISKLRD